MQASDSSLDMQQSANVANPNQHFNISSRLLWIILIGLVTLSNINGLLVRNLDDLSVLRASSYLYRYSNDPLVQQLKGHLEANDALLTAQQYDRYQIRLTVMNNYVAQNYLVGLLEKLPLYSPYQSVFIATWVLHILAVISLFLVFDWLFGDAANALKVSFLFSLIPIAFFPFFDKFMSPFPFQSADHTWFISAPRGATFTFFFAVLLLANALGDPAIDAKKRWGAAIVLLFISFMSHLSMAVLLLIPTVLVAGFYAVLQRPYQDVIRKMGIRRFMLLFNGAWILIALGKFLALSFLQANGTMARFVVIAIIITFWIIATNLLIYHWLKLRLNSSDEATPCQSAGDIFVAYLVPFAIVGIGYNLVQPETFHGTWFIPFEVGFRMLGLTHILWWMLLGVYLHERIKNYHISTIRRLITVTLIGLCIGMLVTVLLNTRNGNNLFNRDLFLVRASALLAGPPEEIYASEIIYFQAVANELKQENQD